MKLELFHSSMKVSDRLYCSQTICSSLHTTLTRNNLLKWLSSQLCRKLSNKHACQEGHSHCSMKSVGLRPAVPTRLKQLYKSQFTKSLTPETILREQFFSTETATETLKRVSVPAQIPSSQAAEF